jgi:Protein-disulfide isomerase
LRAKRRKDGWRRFYLFVAGAFVLVVLVSGGLIAYNMLSGRCDLSVLEGFSEVNVYFDERSSLLPNLSLVALGPERARYEVYVFYDLYCPYCAWEFYESLQVLLGYAVSGKVKLYMVDTILHPEAMRSHGLLRGTVGQGDSYLKALYLASCRLHLAGRSPDASYMRDALSELNATVPDERVAVEEARARQVTDVALRLLAMLHGNPAYVGTPTIVVYDVEFGEVRMILPGRVEPERIDFALRTLP